MTQSGIELAFAKDISTHTLTWSVTYRIVNPLMGIDDFNSHAHVERDVDALDRIETIGISTHTLTWSVTKGYHVEVTATFNFNSHAHVERDGGKI